MTPDLAGIETPAALVDLARVRRNLRTAADYCTAHGLGWRPHVKTHKSPELARMQLAAGAIGLTVATPREAEVMADVCGDLLMAHPPVGPKVDRIVALAERVRISVALDSEASLLPLAAAAAAAGRTVGVLVEIDVGMGRVGLPDAGDVLALVRRARDLAPAIDWRGILFYPGHIRVPAPEQDALLAEVSQRLGRVLDVLRAAGHHPAVVSGGSTPTLFRSHEIAGLTEIRPGTSIFHDRDSVALGVAGPEDIAYSVLATVVSTGVPGQAVVDAGSKALAKEEFRAGSGEGGYGVLLDRPGIRVRSVSEEHGVLDLSATAWRPSVGERVRIVPNHVCVSVNLQDRLLAFDPAAGSDPGRGGERDAHPEAGAASADLPGLRAIELPGRGRLPTVG
jgi:D-serine deaminase-like pyridoxal phosphate-dependent protein